MINPRALVGSHDLLMITLDALRFDVADEAMRLGLTPHFRELLPGGNWEKRHSPGNFTYSAHQAFFAGFLPVPAEPGLPERHKRLFSAQFEGSLTTSENTLVFDAPDIVSGFNGLGYHTACIGGVGFFNKLNPLGCVLPDMFEESHWKPSFGVTDKDSFKNQVDCAVELLTRLPQAKRLFLFINASAMHQPNCIYSAGADRDTKETQAQALAYVDKHIPRLIATMRKRAPLLVLVFSDHGTAYGEDGYFGHRVSHETVWTVPYSEFVMEAAP